jgi:hypothetical protein
MNENPEVSAWLAELEGRSQELGALVRAWCVDKEKT